MRGLGRIGRDGVRKAGVRIESEVDWREERTVCSIRRAAGHHTVLRGNRKHLLAGFTHPSASFDQPSSIHIDSFLLDYAISALWCRCQPAIDGSITASTPQYILCLLAFRSCRL